MHLFHYLIVTLVALSSIASLLIFCMTLTPPTPVQIGKSTTVVWGTAPGGTAVAPIVTSMVVTSINLEPRNPKAIGEVEDGNGALLTSIMLADGFEGTVEGVFDSALTYPVLYGTVTLVLPVAICLDAAAAVPTVYHTYLCLIMSNPVKFERKGVSMITFNISHAPGRDGAPSA